MIAATFFKIFILAPQYQNLLEMCFHFRHSKHLIKNRILKYKDDIFSLPKLLFIKHNEYLVKKKSDLF